MSKITQEKKAAKAAGKELKGKQKKIAESEARKAESGEIKAAVKSAPSAIPNYGCCCTCKHFPGKLNGVTQPCKIAGKYVARKLDGQSCYKCKIG